MTNPLGHARETTENLSEYQSVYDVTKLRNVGCLVANSPLWKRKSKIAETELQWEHGT